MRVAALTAAGGWRRTSSLWQQARRGLGEAWLAAADVRVRIPMAGQVDSLNLSASAALLMYEVVRQRGAEKGRGEREQGSGGN